MKMLTKGPLTIMLILSSIQYLCGGCCGCCKTKTENKTKNTKPTPPNKTKTLGKKTSTQPDKTTEPDDSGDKSNNPSTKQPNDLENKVPDNSFKDFKPDDFKSEINNLAKCSKQKGKKLFGKCKAIYSNSVEITESFDIGENSIQTFSVVIEFKNAEKAQYKIVTDESNLDKKEGQMIVKFEKGVKTCTIIYTPKKKKN